MTAQPELPLRPSLPHELRLRRRGPGSVLVTGGRPGALVLSGLTDAEVRAATGLTATLRTPHRIALPTPSARWAAVLERIEQAAARLSPGDCAAMHVAVLGEGPLPRAISQVLAQMVERVSEHEATVALGSTPTISRPDLVIMPAMDAVAIRAGRKWHAQGIAHLPVVVSGDLLMVGPLVQPGIGPCLECLDMHRSTRDPGWATWLTARGAEADRELDAPPELRATAAGLAALIVAEWQDRRPIPAGLAFSVQRPHPRVRHHLWTRHPACCGCAGPGVTMNS